MDLSADFHIAGARAKAGADFGGPPAFTRVPRQPGIPRLGMVLCATRGEGTQPPEEEGDIYMIIVGFYWPRQIMPTKRWEHHVKL